MILTFTASASAVAFTALANISEADGCVKRGGASEHHICNENSIKELPSKLKDVSLNDAVTD